MSINTALSGLRAAQGQLDVISNNIANASTTAFKRSRAEFADVYAAGAAASAGNQAGSGVAIAAITQQFEQGNIEYTNQSLDMAVSGNGMFIIRDGDETSYTRSGAMQMDDRGFITTSGGANLIGYLADENGNIQAELNPIRIDSAQQAPKPTTRVDTQLNLNSEVDPITATFDPTNEETFHFLTTVAVYDSMGRDYTMQQYFVKTAENDWEMYPRIDGQDLIGGNSIGVTFDSAGAVNGITPAGGASVDPTVPTAVTIPVAGAITGSADPLNVVFDLGVSTQYGSDFGVSEVSQDGYTSGRLASLSIEDNGDILVRYTNGRSALMGQVAIAGFTNQQGLAPIGGTAWIETAQSGAPIVGRPGTGTLGEIQSGALEGSNVDTSEELVSLITAQRNYQANAKVIETAETVNQAILNLR